LGFNSTVLHLNYQGPQSSISFVVRGKLGIQKWTSSPISMNEKSTNDASTKRILNSTFAISNSSSGHFSDTSENDYLAEILDRYYFFTKLSIIEKNSECGEIRKKFSTTLYVEDIALEKFIENEKMQFNEIPSIHVVPAKCFDFQVEKTCTDEALAQLHQLGILNFDNFNTSQLRYLKHSNPLIRDIKLLDKMNR
jgi:hypothetical protein